MLRQKAESSLTTTHAQAKKQTKKMTPDEAQHLVHELQVHQIELEMQNEELRRTQQELEVARDRYATLFDLTPVGYVTLDENERIMEANLTFCRLAGVSRSALLKKKFELFIDRNDQAAFRRHLDALKMKSGTVSSDILTLRHSQIFHRVRLQSSREIMKPPGTDAIIRITVVDVTEREQIKKIQEEQKAMMEVVIGGVMDAIMTTDEEERIVLFNKAAETMFRCSASNIIGQTLDQFIPERFRKTHHLNRRQFIQKAATTGRTGFTREIMALRADGGEFPAEITVSMVEVNPWGSSTGNKLFAVVLRDITERRHAQEAIKKEQEFIAAILDTAAALILVTDPDGEIIRFNRACENLTGYSVEEVQHGPF